MAKKTENKQAVTPAVSEDKSAVSENVSTRLESASPESTSPESASPESAFDAIKNTGKMDEILNNDAELCENAEPLDEDPGKGQPEEKILFYVKTVNDKTAVRSAPEYPMAGASNVIGIITDREPYGIVDVVNGFGRIAGGTGWIMLDSSVVMRQG